MFSFLDDVKSPSCFPSPAQDALLSPPPNVDQHLRQHFFNKNFTNYIVIYQTTSGGAMIASILSYTLCFMEILKNVLRSVCLDSDSVWAAAAREREGKPSPSFPQCWGKKYIPGLTSDPGLVLIYFSKLSSPPRSKYRGEIEMYTGIPREFKENDLWDRISVATNEWVIEVGCISLINIGNEDLIQLFLPSRIFNLVH